MKHLKPIIAFALALVMVLSVTPSVNAAVNSVDMVNSNTYYSGTVVSTSWTTVATSTTGFNCNVYIQCMNTGVVGLKVVPSDIRMLGKSGNVIWSEDAAIAGQGNRIFYCGSDVYTIQIRTQGGDGLVYIHETSENPPK